MSDAEAASRKQQKRVGSRELASWHRSITIVEPAARSGVSHGVAQPRTEVSNNQPPVLRFDCLWRLSESLSRRA